MANTRDIYGEQETLDALIANDMSQLQIGLTEFEDDGVTELHYQAFGRNIQLTRIVLPNVRSIGFYAMYYCTNLTELFLGSNIKVYFSGNELPVKFKKFNEGAIYVPDNMVSEYRNDASIGEYRWHIVGESEYPCTNFDTIKDDYSTFISKLANGTANYAVGDYKTIDVGTSKIRIQVVAKNADELSSGNGTAAYTWVAMDLMDSRHMNTSATTEGGWEDCAMRSYLESVVLPDFPSELRALIVPVKKYSSTYENSVRVNDGSVTNDKLWLPSYREIFGGNNYETQGPEYSGFFQNNYWRIREYKYNGTASWWLRTATSGTSFAMTSGTGTTSNTSAHYSYYICLGFCTNPATT